MLMVHLSLAIFYGIWYISFLYSLACVLHIVDASLFFCLEGAPLNIIEPPALRLSTRGSRRLLPHHCSHQGMSAWCANRPRRFLAVTDFDQLNLIRTDWYQHGYHGGSAQGMLLDRPGCDMNSLLINIKVIYKQKWKFPSFTNDQ